MSVYHFIQYGTKGAGDVRERLTACGLFRHCVVCLSAWQASPPNVSSVEISALNFPMERDT